MRMLDKTQKIIIGILILLIGLTSLVIYLYYQSQKSSSLSFTGQTEEVVNKILPSSEISFTEAIIEVDEESLTPASVKISKGTQVTWINKGKKPISIYSEPHPSHTLLPELRTDEPLSENESFSFIFEKPGTFYYHEENNPQKLQGMVIVE